MEANQCLCAFRARTSTSARSCGSELSTASKKRCRNISGAAIRGMPPSARMASDFTQNACCTWIPARCSKPREWRPTPMKAPIRPQTFFDVACGLIGAFMWGGRPSLGFEQRAGIQVQHAFCVKSEAILADGGMPRIAAPEIFRHRFFDAVDNSLPQDRADVDVLARNAQRHWFASIFSPG